MWYLCEESIVFLEIWDGKICFLECVWNWVRNLGLMLWKIDYILKDRV